MVDVGQKQATHRIAITEGHIQMQPETLALILAGDHKKGDVLGIARVAGIMAAKRKPVDKVEVASLGVEEGADPFYQVVNFELPPAKAAGTIIQGEDDPAGAAAQLVKALRETAKVI